MSKKTPSWIKYAIFAVVIAAAYFINVEVQTRLGEKALQEMGIDHLPLEVALVKAKAENKLVLADMSAIWCPTCRSLDKHLFTDPVVQQAINAKYVFARIEYESPEGEAFMQTYDTRSFPTLLVLSPSGEKLKELPITTDPAEFLLFL